MDPIHYFPLCFSATLYGKYFVCRYDMRNANVVPLNKKAILNVLLEKTNVVSLAYAPRFK